jgi:hypothetical protein
MTASTTLERAGSALPEVRAAQASHSRFVQRIRRRYATDLTQLPEGLPNREAMQQAVERLRSGGRDLASAMRVTRQLVLERMAVLDIEQAASLDDVTHTMTILAEVTLEAALAQARLDSRKRRGARVSPHRRPRNNVWRPPSCASTRMRRIISSPSGRGKQWRARRPAARSPRRRFRGPPQPRCREPRSCRSRQCLPTARRSDRRPAID